MDNWDIDLSEVNTSFLIVTTALLRKWLMGSELNFEGAFTAFDMEEKLLSEEEMSRLKASQNKNCFYVADTFEEE